MFSSCPPKNEHPVDQLLRVVLGLSLLALVMVGPKTQWGLLGILPLMTGLSGRCPLYFFLGWNTRMLGRKRLDLPQWPEGEGVGRPE